MWRLSLVLPVWITSALSHNGWYYSVINENCRKPIYRRDGRNEKCVTMRCMNLCEYTLRRSSSVILCKESDMWRSGGQPQAGTHFKQACSRLHQSQDELIGERNAITRRRIERNNRIGSWHHEVHTEAQNATILRNVTDYIEVLSNKTRWSGKMPIFDRFVLIYDQLRAVSRELDADLFINLTSSFFDSARHYGRIIEGIEEVTNSLQCRGNSLATCTEDVRKLRKAIYVQKNMQGAHLYRCKLGSEYIGEDGSIETETLFESGVMKIQEGKKTSSVAMKGVLCQYYLSAQECLTEWMMLFKVNLAWIWPSNSPSAVICSLILGSVAEVERPWSTSEFILGEIRQFMAPEMFEVLIFFKLNMRFWDAGLVSDADKLYCEETW